MATYNTALGNLLALSENQALWIQDLVNALGPTRTLVIKHWDAAPGNATPDDAWASGTIVWQSSLIGALAPSNGALRTLGKIKNVTVRQAANLGAGMAVMRVSGNGNWLQAAVGNVNSGREVKLSVIDPSAGLAFGSNFAIYAPSELPADAGVDADMPYRVEYEPWEGGVPGVRQVAFYDNPQAPLIFADPVKNARLGAVPYCQSTASFINGGGYLDGGYEFELGIHRWRMPPACNDEDPTKPVWQVWVASTPTGNRWTGYPTMDGYDINFDSTILRPCKIYFYAQDGRLLHVMQSLRDQVALNDPNVHTQQRTSTQAWRPFVTTSGMLYWCSHRLKEAPEARQIYAGTRAEYWHRPKQSKQRTSSNAVIPSFGLGGTQVNGFLHPLLMPEWSQPSSRAGFDVDEKTDPHVAWETQNAPSSSVDDGGYYPTHAAGWRFDYGAYNAGHDPAHAPGGMRGDRYPVDSLLAYYMTDPTGVRLQGSVPWRTLLDEKGKGFFNLNYHHVKNAKTLEMFPVSQAGYGGIGHWEGYYNARSNADPGPADPENWIRLHGFNPNGTNYNNMVDRDGLRPYNTYVTDSHHPYHTPGVYFTHFDSVAHAISQKLKWYAMVMSWNKNNASPGANMVNLTNYEATEENMQLFMRQHAWRWLQMAFVWKSAGDHPLLVNRADIEEIWRLHLESIYDNVVVPATDPQHPNYNHYFFQGMRNLGTAIRRVVVGSDHHYRLFNDDKRFYFMGVLVWLRTLGCFDRLRQINSKCADALDWCVNCYVKGASDRFVATKAARSYGVITPTVPTTTPLVVPASWAEVASVMQAGDASDMVRNADGSPYMGSDSTRERSLYQHIFQQACYDLVRHFPDYSNPNGNAAVAMCEEFEEFVHAQVQAGQADYKQRWIATGPMLADV